jgi:hypothetical protein
MIPGSRSVEGRMTAATACRARGAESLENARFCHRCGSPIAVSESRAEYKQVTVLFADVVHSMDIAAAVGAERSDADLEEAREAIDRLAAVPIEPGFVLHELPLLRLRALLATAHGDESGYRDFADRYRSRATELGFEGHITLADAMT